MRLLIRVLAVAAVAAVAPATASAATYTKEARTLRVWVGPDDQTICRVAADLYKPDDATAANPAPAILATNGFGGSKADFASLGAAYAGRGYVFLAYSGLGFGGSACKITLDDRDWDGKAGSQLISFLGGSKTDTSGNKIDFVRKDGKDHAGNKRTDDPRVGMVGGSYGGQVQFAVAGIDPRLDAIVPQITWNDLSYSLAGNNTDFKTGVTSSTPGVAKLDWPVFFFGVGVGQGMQQALQDQDASHVGGCPNFPDYVCQALVETALRGYPNADTTKFLQHASVASFVDKITIPTLISQGLHDTLFDIQEAVATYRALLAQKTPVKMVWRSAGHSGGGLGTSEWSAANPEAAWESRTALEWFDYYLRGLGDRPRLDFSFYRDWIAYEGDAAPAVGSSAAYPVGTDQDLHISGGDALVVDKAAAKPGTASFLAGPTPANSGGGSVSPPPYNDIPGTFAAFTTPALGAEIDAVGVPSLDLALSAPAHAAAQSADPATKLVLFVRLADVAADGKTTVPGDIVSSVRVADVTKPVKIELPGIAHRFAKGHKVQLVVSQSNAIRRGNAILGPVTVTSGTLRIPQLGEPIGRPGTGPGGSTPFQPSPSAPPAQTAGAGGSPSATQAAVLPRPAALATCRSRRRSSITLRKPAKGDKVKSATITVNGITVKRVRGDKTRYPIILTGLPRGTFRVVVTARTQRGRTLRSARTYRTCTAR